MSSSDLSLPSDLQEFVASKVRSGSFATESEVVQEALRLLRDRDGRLAELRQEIRPALEELDRGEGQPLDIADIARRGRERHAARGD